MPKPAQKTKQVIQKKEKEVSKNALKVGLEIHGYLLTKEKLFCSCATPSSSKKDLAPNTSICPVCTGQPGAKPMLPNKTAVENVIKIAAMLNSSINAEKKLVWQRKHYSWPDLPKGYQNSMSGAYSIPLGEKGNFLGINIRSVHLEEDPAAWNPETGEIDYNRSGLPLVEIVTEPDFTSADQVIEWLKNLLLTLSYARAIDKISGIKADVNVSTGGERVEIKNINSLDAIKKAIEFEAQRQQKEPAQRQTRRFDDKTGKTILMRTKEQEDDYRFIPDPDLPVLIIKKELAQKIMQNLPESPKKKLEKLIKQHKIDKKNADILTQNLEIVEFFEKVAEKIDPKFALPWVTIELLRVLNWNKKTLDEVNINPQHFIELLQLVKEGKVTELKAKQTLNDFVPQSFSPKEKLQGHEKISQEKEIESFCKQAIEKNPQAAQDYKAGKQEALNFLLGEVMKISQRRADYKVAREAMIKLLKR